LFTHVLPDPAAIAAQNDTISVNVSSLRSRDIFIQVMFVPLPLTIPDGMYNVSIGVYDTDTQQRMNVFDNDEQRGTRLFIGQIRVSRG
jgi:hypothetical protein